MAKGYPTPDAQDGDVVFNCYPITVPDNPEFEQLFIAAIYGLYASMSKSYFWRATGTLTPELAAEYASRGLALTEAYENCGEDCSDELLPSHHIITYDPQDPHTEPDLVPDGYLLPPFWVFGEVLPEFITDWFGGLIEELTGYNLPDVLLTIGSFPLLADWFDIAGFALPQIQIAVSGVGEIELHLLAVPFGGRALITIDESPTLADIVSGLWNDSDSMVDTVLDITSVPPETATEIIIERTIETEGAHIVYVTFIPVVDDELIPLGFGGGLRSVVWCGDTMPDCPECPDCPEQLTIPELIVEGDTFETEYAPAVFGEYWSETIANEAAQAAAYDSTPQSIAPDAPTGVPDDVEKNALCAAVNRFVGLYASTKLCLIQSKNFIEIFWTKLAGAANDFYDVASNLMSPIYSPNIFSCFVSDAAAITALQNDSAIEELACFIYDELKTVTMSQSNFDDAITTAATTLTGDAGDIACLMLNDNNLSLYINMLEAYNVTLSQGSDELDCPCETGSYRLWAHDFSSGMGVFSIITGALESGRIKGTGSTPTALPKLFDIVMPMDPTWRLLSVKLYMERSDATAQGTNGIGVTARQSTGSDTGSTAVITGQTQVAGTFEKCNTIAYTTDKRQLRIFGQITKTGVDAQIYLDKVEILYVDGYAPSGAKTNDADLCT